MVFSLRALSASGEEKADQSQQYIEFLDETIRKMPLAFRIRASLAFQ